MTVRSPLRPTPSNENPEPAAAVGPGGGLPGGRAVVGGLLVAVAAVGAFATASGAGQGPSTRYLVAARNLPAGTVLRAEHLDRVALDLPAGSAAHAYREPGSLVGRSTLSALRRGELVQESQVGAVGETGAAVVALAMPSAEAVGGDLVPGDRVDVYATVGDGADASTRLFAPDLRVVEVTAGSGALGSTADVTVHLAVRPEEQRLELVHAAHVGSITLVRTTTAPGATAAGTADDREAEPG